MENKDNIILKKRNVGMTGLPTSIEDNKYYTPSIEEFHVGFEYERQMKEENDDVFQYDGPAWIGCT